MHYKPSEKVTQWRNAFVPHEMINLTIMKCATTENHAKTATHRNRSVKLLLMGGDNANGKSENRKIYKFPKK